MTATLSQFADSLRAETAFDVLAIAKKLKAAGKDVIELQIGDSPFPTPKHAKAAGIAAIVAGESHYCASPGMPILREAVARTYRREYGVEIGPENVVIGSGAKIFEQFFCEAFLEAGDAVLIFTPHFPTYEPNLHRRGAHAVLSPLKQANQFRPDLNDVERFLKTPRARAIFLNSPHNPTGGVATADDLHGIADLVRGRDVAVFSDEPYCHMVWQGRHEPLLGQPGILDQTVAAYTFSKSYSMSGWRLGYAVTSPSIAAVFSKLINTSLSCVPPLVQAAGAAALDHDAAERDEVMARFHLKVKLLVEALRGVEGVTVLMPPGTFYAFPNVSAICKRLGITSHGLALYLLEGADDQRGVACLGGECFGTAGQGFLRFSCAEPDDRLRAAVAFLAEAITRTERVAKFLGATMRPRYRLVIAARLAVRVPPSRSRQAGAAKHEGNSCPRPYVLDTSKVAGAPIPFRRRIMPTKVPRHLLYLKFYEAEQAYLRSLPLEHFMEATPQAKQREITLESLALVTAQRTDVHVFNELLVQYERKGEKRFGQVVPDNMVVIHDGPIKAEGSYNLPLQPAEPFMMLEYVSNHNKRKDYDDNMDKYERQLKVPYYMLFQPDVQELTLYRHNRRKYVSVKPNEEERHPIPELDLEVALLDGWVRFWFRGELLPLPGELAQSARPGTPPHADTYSDARYARRRADAAEEEVARLRAEMERLRRRSGNGK